MCGIIGYFAKGAATPDPAAFDRAVDALEHRGPDRRGVWREGPVGLGFRRLSILDLETGDQPMANEEGNLHLVFNGEIYNFAELRAELEAKGHRFRTRSDTETILHLYEEEGEACVARLRGMFAFALHDRRRGTLFLARDRFGKKPLVWRETASGFYFASEIGALLELDDGGREADPEALDACLALQYVPSPRTAWRGMRRLPAAHTLRVERGVAAPPQRYWRLDWSAARAVPRDAATALTEFREIFEESVRLRMVADVPLGAFLSGGVDSTATVAAMTRLGGRVKTFTIAFDDPRFDESAFAREAAQRLGTDHHELRVAPDALDILDPLLAKLGEPFADQSLLPTFLLSRFTRQHVTVALSGDGGDELFAGYKRYDDLRRAENLTRFGLARPWLGLSRLIFQIERGLNPTRRRLIWPRTALDRILPLPARDRYLALVGCWPAPLRAALWRKKTEEDLAVRFLRGHLVEHAAAGRLGRWQALDMETWLTDDILRKVDTAGMACSLECRCPLLDQRVAEFSARLPDSLRRGGGSKWLLRQFDPERIPPSFFDRRKKGFSMPIGDWMRKQWREPVREAMEGPWSGGMESHFDREFLRRIWREHDEGREDHGLRLWAWLVLTRWNARFRPVWE